MKPVLVLAAVALLAGCQARAPGVAASWQSRSLGDLVAAWGPPDAAATLTDGRQVVTYRRMRMYAAGAAINTLDCEITYTADARGTITDARVRGHFAECNRLVDGRGG